MNLFIDTLSEVNVLILFNENREIVKKYDFDVKMNESTKLIPEIDNFLKNCDLNYNDLENIVVVAWPWSFTWIRTLVILVNTINYVIQKNITPITFFDLYDSFPVIKRSSKRDSFVKFDNLGEVLTIYNDELVEKLNEKWIKNINSCSDFEWFICNKIPDYEEIIKNIKFQNYKKIDAFYLKKPNIF